MSFSLDKSWITLRQDNPLFRDGVKSFLQFSKVHIPSKEKIKCPCLKCGNKRISISYDEVEYHLVKWGFTPTYTIWSFHGEVSTSDLPAQGISLEHSKNVVDPSYFIDDFDKLFEDVGDTEDGAVQDDVNTNKYGEPAVGSIVIQLYNLKVTGRWSDKTFTELLQLLRKALPQGNEVPPNTFAAGNIIKDVNLGYEKIHACPRGCILYWEKYANEKLCPTCLEPRYKIEKTSKNMSTQVPARVLRYFPITPRLKRMYSVPWVAKEMTWHTTGRMPTGKMGHPVDSRVWKALDYRYKDFAAEPRNVRLGLATDGINPFGLCRTSYSCWPVMCVPYNLPPHLCMKPQFTMLTLLIDGPKQPRNKIDVFFQPLVRELQGLWASGANMLDAYSHTHFNMRAALLWTIHDFPALRNVSGCMTKGEFGCPSCGPNTDSEYLHHGMKTVYMGFRRWLSFEDEYRNDTSTSTFNGKKELRRQPHPLTGTQVKEITSNPNVQWGKKKE